jgi:two-component system, cell cycle sensor histidine kinase and response regulator CckA
VKSIIVVDDDAAVRSIAARILAEEGFRVFEASDGDEAIRLAERHRPEIGLVVSDIVMPRLNGIELLERLSRIHPALPVVLMSGYTSAELMSRALVAPCGILTKPFAPEALIEEVRRCLATAA